MGEIKMAPSEFCRFGDFSYRFTKEASDFYTSVGFPKNLSDKMVGTKMWFKIIDMSKGKDGKEGKHRVCCHFNIEGFPEYSSCYVATEGEKNMINCPLMGGRAVYTFKKTEKGYDDDDDDDDDDDEDDDDDDMLVVMMMMNDER